MLEHPTSYIKRAAVDNSFGGKVKRYVEEWRNPLLKEARGTHEAFIPIIGNYLQSGGNLNGCSLDLDIYPIDYASESITRLTSSTGTITLIDNVNSRILECTINIYNSSEFQIAPAVSLKSKTERSLIAVISLYDTLKTATHPEVASVLTLLKDLNTLPVSVMTNNMKHLTIKHTNDNQLTITTTSHTSFPSHFWREGHPTQPHISEVITVLT